MSRPILEVIALTPEDAVAAEAGGADRLELITDIAADGLTPPAEVFTEIRAAVSLPLRVMLRTTDGFLAQDPDALYDTAKTLRAAGADEFVLGFLDETGTADLGAVHAVTDAIGDCRWTFHRALDHAVDRETVRKQLDGMPGLDTYLTAGSPEGVDAGLDTLIAEAGRRRAGEPGYEPTILVGGGLQQRHVAVLLDAGVDAFHVGGAVRPAGWSGPVDAAAVRRWRRLLT